MQHSTDLIAQLVSDLQGDDDFTRARAAFALGMLGEQAIEPLIDLLGHAQHSVRMRASWALGIIGMPALDRLLELAEGPATQLRIEAIRVLGVIGEGRAVNPLIHALTDPDPRMAQRAAVALGKIGDPQAFHPLLTALHHPSPDVRYAVCGALANLRVSSAIEELERIAVHDPGVTSWGAPVGPAARMAVQALSASKQVHGNLPDQVQMA
jgi:HEAT repeat protein